MKKTLKIFLIINIVLIIMSSLIFFSHKSVASNFFPGPGAGGVMPLDPDLFYSPYKIKLHPPNPRIGDPFALLIVPFADNIYSIEFVRLEVHNVGALDFAAFQLNSPRRLNKPLEADDSASASIEVLGPGESTVETDIAVTTAPLLPNGTLDLTKKITKKYKKRTKVVVPPKATGVKKINIKGTVVKSGKIVMPHPSNKYEPIGAFPLGKEIKLTGKKGDWYQIDYTLYAFNHNEIGSSDPNKAPAYIHASNVRTDMVVVAPKETNKPKSEEKL